ncbi:O-antigen/teichoic acid export membrane protein [Lachnospiraceae bacterium PF1-21]|uniref:Oligosaccharide flippase family protein n=1 Tax=Ohessyouella blattaphilus TaxID=2949333 RepID=A0ABT1ELD0_9FIRM|nr:oligosaccharide flippase family protein [Ohessyouella blattaphilus]MCP1111504.1 oligosaccharide flippase family protein [Ohessyouella blattaphilus]MCR8564898.1 oligosaccharide flippase family protein [Ohessyouella blattaphilus]
MSRAHELVKNFAVLSFGKFLPKIVSIITLPIVTARLSKTEYGTYDLIITLVMLAIPIATMQIQSAAFRFLIDSRGDYEKTSEIITNIIVVVFPITLIVSVGIFVFIPMLDYLERLVVAIYFLVDSMAICLGQVVRGLGKNKIYSISSIILASVNGAGIILAVEIMGKGLLGVMVSLVVANFAAIIYLCITIRIWNYLSMCWVSNSKIKELLRYSWPMVPNNLSTWILKLSDRIIITLFLGITENAVYSVANKIPNLLSIAQSVMVMAWQENASIAVGDKDAGKYYSRVLNQVFDLMFGCTALLIAGTPIMFRLLINGKYEDAYFQIPVLVLGMFFFVMSSFFGGIYVAHKKTLNVGISTMVAAAINIILDLCFVQNIGIWAGSLSTLISYMFLYCFRLVNCRKFQQIDMNIKRQLGQLSLLVLMIIICFKQSLILNIVNLVLGAVFFLIFNLGIVRRILNLLHKR